MDNNFLSKLRYLSGDRDITPWLKSMGFSAGLVGKVLKGQPASADLLRSLSRTERVSLRWLEGAGGPVYDVWRVINDQEALEKLEAHLDDEDWSVLLVTHDDGEFVVVLHQPGAYSLRTKGSTALKEVEYHIVEVFSGNITLDTIRVLDQRDKANWVLYLTEDDFNRLACGYMGNMELFGFDDPRKSKKGLYDKVKSTLHDSTLREILEKGHSDNKSPVIDAGQAVKAGSEDTATQLNQLTGYFERLDAESKAVIINLLKVMSRN